LSITIALDAMGGDRGPEVVVQAVLEMMQQHTTVRFVLVGDQQVLTPLLRRHRVDVGERLGIEHASQCVEMGESPSAALRSKKDSSMRVAINLVKDKTANACVSSGNTGALMATARFVLKTLPGIDRPAIMSEMPTMQGHTFVLDLGANVNLDAENLFQFAVMGSVLASVRNGQARPSIGLLNIGEEEIKGNEQVKEAARLLQNSELNYVGFVEGDDICKGSVDVVVCDGFVGNVALKAIEGVAKMIAHFMREEFSRSLWTKLVALLARPILRALRNRIDPRKYNGASFVGLQGIVVKSHGGADVMAFANAIEVAILEVSTNVPNLIHQQLEQYLLKRQVG